MAIVLMCTFATACSGCQRAQHFCSKRKLRNNGFALDYLTDRIRCLSSSFSIRSDSGSRIRQPAVGDGKVP